MKKFANRRQEKEEEYRVGDLVLLSTKDLKWKMKGRRSEKLTEHFIGPYKVKGIVMTWQNGQVNIYIYFHFHFIYFLIDGCIREK